MVRLSVYDQNNHCISILPNDVKTAPLLNCFSVQAQADGRFLYHCTTVRSNKYWTIMVRSCLLTIILRAYIEGSKPMNVGEQ